MTTLTMGFEVSAEVECGRHRTQERHRGLWERAARKQGLKFAVSEHLAFSYLWWPVSHRSDQTGPMAAFLTMVQTAVRRPLSRIPKESYSRRQAKPRTPWAGALMCHWHGDNTTSPALRT